MLLIGNQGVGKNKLADYFLQRLRLPREYIQLHRDSTVEQLTSMPCLTNGVLSYQDSPLVRACRMGHLLVVDEADKAPLEVVCILKALVEDLDLQLSDGRRLCSMALGSSTAHDPMIIPVSPDFRMIVLANRPGFPFLGNDFYRECGDVFSCHSVDNPDVQSEVHMLTAYGPHVNPITLNLLSDTFHKVSVHSQIFRLFANSCYCMPCAASRPSRVSKSGHVSEVPPPKLTCFCYSTCLQIQWLCTK